MNPYLSITGRRQRHTAAKATHAIMVQTVDTRWAEAQRALIFGLWLSIALAVLTAGTGCMSGMSRVTSARDAIPSYRLPPHLAGPARGHKVPIDFTLLRQQPPKDYLLGPRDVVGVYIQDVVPPTRDEPLVAMTQQSGRDPFPAAGLVQTPVVGVPMTVQSRGSLPLPLVDPVQVSGLTIEQASEKIRRAYTVDKKVLQPGRDRIMVSMIRPRVHRVLVIREDSATPTSVYQRQGEVLAQKRGTADVIDLPAYENDVLHALLASGGLPGIDAYNDVWILRSRENDSFDATAANVQAGGDPRRIVANLSAQRSYVKIPLRMNPGEAAPFGPEDIILQDGDIVYLEPRTTDYFYTGGLLGGAQFPLPRDYDLDVIGAIAFANSGVAGPAGGIAGVAANNRYHSPGALVPPTRVLVLRTLPSGEQLRIRVDLSRALHDPRERLIIQPGDVVMLQYKPGECYANIALNICALNFTILTSGFNNGAATTSSSNNSGS